MTEPGLRQAPTTDGMPWSKQNGLTQVNAYGPSGTSGTMELARGWGHPVWLCLPDIPLNSDVCQGDFFRHGASIGRIRNVLSLSDRLT